MNQGKQSSVLEPVGNSEVLKFGSVEDSRSILDRIVRDGARKMLQVALEDEVNAFLESQSSKVDQSGRRQVVRNGYMKLELLVSTLRGDIRWTRYNIAKLAMRKTYGFKVLETIQIALHHQLTNLPDPKSTHRFW